MRWSIALLLFAAPLLVAADGSPAQYFPPDTKVVIGLQVRSVVTPLVDSLGPDLRTKSSTFLAQTPFAGFDPLKDLDEVLIASAAKGQDGPSLVILRGRFDVDKLSANATRYHGVAILQGKPNETLAVLDASTALAGDPATVHAAIDRRGGASSWAGRIEPLRARYSLWGIGEGLESLASKDAPVSGLESMDRFQFAVDLDHGLDLSAEAHLRSPQDAEKLGASLQLFETMIKANPNAPHGTRFATETRQGTLKLSLQVPEEELRKAVASQRATLERAVMSQLPADLAAQIAPPSGPVQSRPVPSSESKIVTNGEGETVTVTLPGGKR